MPMVGYYFTNSPNTTVGTLLTVSTTYTTAGAFWDSVGHTWVGVGTGGSLPASSVRYRACMPEPETPEQRVGRERHEALARAEVVRERRETRRAKLRSLRLLKEVLGPGWEEYRLRKRVVVGSRLHPGQRYVVRPDQMIDVIDADGRVADKLCIHTRDWVPEGDDVVVKLMLAKNDEEGLWRTANRHGGDRLRSYPELAGQVAA